MGLYLCRRNTTIATPKRAVFASISPKIRLAQSWIKEQITSHERKIFMSTTNIYQIMKKLFLLFGLLILSSSLVVTGCKKDENPSNNSGGNTSSGAGTMSAKIDGQNWSATQLSPILPAAQASYTNRTLTVIGSRMENGRTSTMSFSINNVTGTGTFQIGTTTGGASYGEGPTGAPQQAWVSFGDNAGTVEITTFNAESKIVSGTFRFTLRNPIANPTSREVTEGRFDVKWN